MRTHVRLLAFCAALVLPAPAIAAELIKAPAVPQPTHPGDLVGVVLQNTLTRTVPPRTLTFGMSFARGQLNSGHGIAAFIDGRVTPAQIDIKNRYSDGSALFGIVKAIAACDSEAAKLYKAQDCRNMVPTDNNNE